MKKCLQLRLFDVCSLGALAAIGDFKRNLLPLVQSLEAVALDRAEVDENVAALIGGDESVALRCVEPFYCAVAFQSVASQQEKLQADTPPQMQLYLFTGMLSSPFCKKTFIFVDTFE